MKCQSHSALCFLHVEHNWGTAACCITSLGDRLIFDAPGHPQDHVLNMDYCGLGLPFLDMRLKDPLLYLPRALGIGPGVTVLRCRQPHDPPCMRSQSDQVLDCLPKRRLLLKSWSYRPPPGFCIRILQPPARTPLCHQSLRVVQPTLCFLCFV